MSDLYKYFNSSALFTNPSFGKGTARVVDFFGLLNEYNTSPTEEEADVSALKRDWSIIGKDIGNSINSYEQEQKKTPNSPASNK